MNKLVSKLLLALSASSATPVPVPLPPTPAPAPPANPCTTCRGPQWTWDTFPAFFHGSDKNGPGGGFTEQALDTIARFPMATIEKWQGSSVTPFMFEEEAWVMAATQIKKRNPQASVIVWLDSLRIYTANKTLNPDLGSPCTTGNFRPAEFLETHPDYLVKNSSGLPALESWSRCHIFDHTKQVARDFWRDMCLTMTASGVIDGCGADASEKNAEVAENNWNLNNKTAVAWDLGHRSMMKMTTEALADGLLMGKDPWELGDYVNGALHEGCTAANATVNTLRNLTATAAALGRRLVYQAHGKGELDEVAAFLCGVGPYQYYGMGDWSGLGEHGNFSDHWLPGVFDRKLGAPTADAQYDAASNTWTRSFASGTAVSFNAVTNKGTISWGELS